MRRLVFCVLALAGFASAWGSGCGSVQTEACPGLEPPANGSVSASVTDVGATANYQCAAGFMLEGASARTCLADGTWSGSAPACAPAMAQCPQLASPANGSLTINGATATYACATGFDLIGAPTRTCQADNTWSGTDPTCAVRCPCFTNTELDRIQADIAAGGTRLCHVDNMGGGTTQTLLMSARTTHRYAGEALENASLPGTHLACGYGCLDDTMNGVNECGMLPAYQRTDNISAAQHATCRALVMPHCDP